MINQKLETLLFEINERIAFITINRPNQLNALNSQVYRELLSVLEKLFNYTEIGAVIITGSGGKAFVAGADITEMRNMSSQEARSFSRLGKQVSQVIESFPVPVIAAINGFALGGGCELAMACDLRLASEKALFGQPEINLGLIPGNGGTQRLARLIGITKAKELVFLGSNISAQEALQIGLINKVVPPEQLMNECINIARKVCDKSRAALDLAKSAINNGIDLNLNSALDYEIECFAQCFATEDHNEGISAFLEKRKPDFKGR